MSISVATVPSLTLILLSLSQMAGKPFKVGRFAHTLRIRLMREHLGVDVDAMYQEDLLANQPKIPEEEVKKWDPDNEQKLREEGVSRVKQPGPTGNIEIMSKDAISQGSCFASYRSTYNELCRQPHMVPKKLGCTQLDDLAINWVQRTLRKLGKVQWRRSARCIRGTAKRSRDLRMPSFQHLRRKW